jgi:oligoribonuclease NrnB/cAMP/cGMP phosphodiesterase (DHH superfamily)
MEQCLRRLLRNLGLGQSYFRHPMEGDSIVFTDFSPDPADAYALYEKGIGFQILDHHISAVNALEKYWETNPKEANIVRSMSILDMNRCGATITWDYFSHGTIERPRILHFIEIADLWKWELDANAKVVTQYIRVEAQIGRWEDMADLLENFDEPIAILAGKILVRRLERDVEDLAKKSDSIKLHGWNVRVCNSSHANSISELGHELANMSSDGVGLIYNIIGKKVKISTRGMKGTSVARELAEKFGGGGHNEAAGAFTDAKAFLELIVK